MVPTYADAPMTFSQKLRVFLWPIYGYEHKKFIPLAIMAALLLFNYTVLRNTKDVLVITSTGGSEITTFLKVWAVLPAALIMFYAYSKLSNLLSRKHVFYCFVSFFLGYFLLFDLFLYPNQDWLHPTEQALWLHETLPSGFKHFINMYQYWSFSLFYVLAELWGSVVATLVFWQFANSIVQINQAKRMYPHLYLLANLTTAFSGQVTKYFATFGSELTNSIESYGVTMHYLILAVVLSGLLVMALYLYMNHYVVTDDKLVNKEQVLATKKKLKMSFKDSLKYILNSKYLLLIAVLVFAYGISMNLIEVAWKNQIGMLYPDPSEQQAFWGSFALINGLVTFVVILFGSFLLRYFGWFFGALATPVMIGVTGTIFFIFLIFSRDTANTAHFAGFSILSFSVMFGAAQNILSKSIKYSLFDSTKEMALIPLDEESKIKGKAAIDVVSGRLGKATGSVLLQVMFVFVGPIMTIAPYSLAILLLVIGLWLSSVYQLRDLFYKVSNSDDSKQKNTKVQKNETLKHKIST